MGDSNDPTPRRSDGDAGEAVLPEPILDDDEVFDALAHRRRRYLLWRLLVDDGPRSLEALARTLAARESGVPEADVDGEDVEYVYASLYHAHVPKLADLDVVEFDRRRETLARGPNAEQVLRVLDLTTQSARPGPETHAKTETND